MSGGRESGSNNRRQRRHPNQVRGSGHTQRAEHAGPNDRSRAGGGGGGGGGGAAGRRGVPLARGSASRTLAIGRFHAGGPRAAQA